MDEREMNRLEAIFEHFNDRFDGVQEILDSMLPLVQRIPMIEQRLDSIESDMKIIKEVVPAHSRDINALKTIHPGLRHA